MQYIYHILLVEAVPVIIQSDTLLLYRDELMSGGWLDSPD